MGQRAYKVAVVVVVVAVIACGVWWKRSQSAQREHARAPTRAAATAPHTGAERALPATDTGRSTAPQAGRPAPPDSALEPDPSAGEAEAPERSDAGRDGESAEPDERRLSLPAVIDLGMGKCIPCKMMKPILDELAAEYTERARIEIIDIGERPEEAERWRVFTIPTQIFLDGQGNEVYRHEGFMPKEDIVAKLEEMGVG